MKTSIIVLAATGYLVGGVCVAEETIFKGDLEFHVSERVAWSPEEKLVLEVDYEIPYDQLQFVKSGDHFETEYGITVILYDTKGKQVTGDVWERKMRETSYEETRLHRKVVWGTISLPVHEGAYRLAVKVEDRKSKRQGELRRNTMVEARIEQGIFLGDLRFWGTTGMVGEGVHIKDLKQAVPAPRRVYADTSLLAVSYQLRSMVPDTALVVTEYEVVDEGGEKVRSGRMMPEKLGKEDRRILALSMEGVESGSYTITIRVLDTKGNELVHRSEQFLLHGSPFLSDSEFYTMVDQLEYISTPEEQKPLREAPVDKREELWDAFWKERDPTPETEQNEYKDEYYRRLTYVEKYFSGFHEGWKSDRGRIYIIYGPPDEIDSHPFDIDAAPYEIWYYYQAHLRFVFWDEYGLGNYVLLNPDGR
jgi:GWxTD domain-containing protein